MPAACPVPWSRSVRLTDAVLSLWPNHVVCDLDVEAKNFEATFGITPVPVGCVIAAGGRCDFFFYVKARDIAKFAVPRFAYGIRWWEDVYFNGQEDDYPLDFRAARPDIARKS